jgi:secreted Zn-dependent insulinase-like peptidase
VGRQLRSFPLEEGPFARRLDVLRQGLRNFKLRQPVSLTSYYRGLVLEQPRYSIEELSAAADALTLPDLRRFQASLVRNVCNVQNVVWRRG